MCSIGITEGVTPPIAAEPRPGRASRLALRIVQFGALTVVLVAAVLHAFELDRFFVPKELTLHVSAALAGLLAWRAISNLPRSRVDWLLLAYLVLSGLSAVLATNRWVAFRAFAISASGIALFWIARALRNAGLAASLVGALALAVVASSITSLLQAYGIETLLFSENRSPGGTLGNRNFVAHVAAFGFPVLLYTVFTAARKRSVFVRCVGIAIVITSLVLTRSRAAWLAFAMIILVTLVAIVASAPLRRHSGTWLRLLAIILVSGCGVAAALLIPNTLRWRSDNPYVETALRVAEFQEGSGRGRLIQYERSLVMALRHSLLGVGPGNWAVEYPAHAARRDPSLDTSEAGMTSNPWPSSDWVANIAERGFAATVLLALAVFFIATSAVRRLAKAIDHDDASQAVAQLGTIVGALVSGLFDAVLLLAVPTFLVWAAVGALSSATAQPAGDSRWPMNLAVLLVTVVAAAGAARSGTQLAAMQIYATGGSLTRAATLDPGNYRVHLRLARSGRRQQRCRHARAAHALYPEAEAAADLSRRCGD